MTTLRPIARRTKTPALANESYQMFEPWTIDSGGRPGSTYIRAVVIAIATTIVSERCLSEVSLSRLSVARTPPGRGAGALAGLEVVMPGHPLRSRTGRTA